MDEDLFVCIIYIIIFIFISISFLIYKKRKFVKTIKYLNKINDQQKDFIKKLEIKQTELVNCFNNEINRLENEYDTLKTTLNECQISYLRNRESIQESFDQLIAKEPHAFSYVASLMADYLTYDIYQDEINLKTSKVSHERRRAAKVHEIREETKNIIIPLKEAQYQLDYLLQIYPELNDVINYEYENTPSLEEIKYNKEKYNDDPVSSYISREEWDNLTPSKRNQLALDRYINRQKSNWEIGRDYELYVAHRYEMQGYNVDTFGSYMQMSDLGRDLIAKKENKIKVIQRKYWSSQKVIHENHICQLFGTVVCYCIENNLKTSDVEAIFVTSTKLSEQAKKFANMLNISIVENFPFKEFPRIKCNIGHDEYGETKIYHLPMDQLYDKVKICKSGECYCTTVEEAETLGFRRAYRWHGN